MASRITLPLALLALAACGSVEPEVCFSVEEAAPNMICGYTTQELEDMSPGAATVYPTVCFPSDACPELCPAQAVIDEYLIPELLDTVPDFEVESAEPLCREDYPEEDECCFVARVIGQG